MGRYSRPHKDEHTKTKPPVSVGMCRCQLPAKKNHLKMKDYIYTKKGATSEPYNDKSYWRSLSHQKTQSNNCSLMLITIIIGPSAKGLTTSNGLQYDSPSDSLAIV